MSTLTILKELVRELVHQQSLWSKSLLLFDEERRSIAASKCWHLSGLLQNVHRHLVDLRHHTSMFPQRDGLVWNRFPKSSPSRMLWCGLSESTKLPPTDLQHFIYGPRLARAGSPSILFVMFWFLIFLSATLVISSSFDVISYVLMEMSHFFVLLLSPLFSSFLLASSLSLAYSPYLLFVPSWDSMFPWSFVSRVGWFSYFGQVFSYSCLCNGYWFF